MALVLNSLYNLPSPERIRDRPMQILCLGLPRSGTDSLRKALVKLGYDPVYHGYVAFGDRPEDLPKWCRLASLKYRQQHITRQDFDGIIGDCVAIADNPCVMFAVELLEAYPDARVIVNRRQDLDAWYTSMMKGPMGLNQNVWLWFMGFFDARLWWRNQLVGWTSRLHFGGSFERHGKEAALAHYQRIDAYLEEKSRRHLKWSVDQGWAPLCEFLGKEVPDEPFPRGNKVEDFYAVVNAAHAPREANAAKNMRRCLAGIIVSSALGYFCFVRFYR